MFLTQMTALGICFIYVVRMGQEIVVSEREACKEGVSRDGSTAMFSAEHVHACEWYRHTTTVFYHMLSSLPCQCGLCAQYTG